MVDFITVLPTHGDVRYLGVPVQDQNRTDPWKNTADREPTLSYLRHVAHAAEYAGFDAILVPTGNSCTDGFVTASALAASTEKLKFLVAARPGFVSPAVFARQFATLDYFSGGRALVNVVTGGSPKDLAADGDFLAHDTRYERTQEFIHLVKRLLTEDGFDHEGAFYKVKNASLFYKGVQQPRPQIYFGGASPAGQLAAAQEADVYMLWGETLEQTKERIDSFKALAAQYNRKLQYSVSLQIILGKTEEQAWNNANEMISKVSPEAIQRKHEQTLANESEGNKRLHQQMLDSRDNGYRIGPNLWAGLTLVSGGNSTAIVGTPDQVSDRIIEYIDLGFEKILLRGYPYLETIQALGSDVLPLVRAKLAARQGAAV